jgi:hypothetical protein
VSSLLERGPEGRGGLNYGLMSRWQQQKTKRNYNDNENNFHRFFGERAEQKKRDRVDESQVGSGAKHTSAFAFKKANTYLNGIIKMIRMMQKTHNVNR